jgi:hypothetical protein
MTGFDPECGGIVSHRNAAGYRADAVARHVDAAHGAQTGVTMSIGHHDRRWSVRPSALRLSAFGWRAAEARLPRRRLVQMAGPLIAGGMWLARSPVNAQSGPLTEHDRAAFREIISRQIEAFRADDGERAFSYASPGVRQMFGSAESFMTMVRSGYRPVYRPQSFRFGAVETLDELYVQRVRLIGPDGAKVVALYMMERQPDGTWRIAGCYLVEDDKSV